jgi:predicted nuclease of predicted toxin-antitoxin system
VRLLFDQNLLRRLVALLAIEHPRSAHDTEVGLDTATDDEIWTYARDHDLVIVSKDSDFRQLAFLHGPPPKAIWVRLGNVSTTEIYEALRSSQDELARFGADVDEALLVLP